MACLIITKGEQVGRYFQLGRRTLAGGRDPAREIQIVDPMVSRKHFLIHRNEHGDGHVIVELQAKNGVWINGQQCHEKVLEDGDEIQVGNTGLIYYRHDQPDRTDAIQQYRQGQREFREDRTITGDGDKAR